MINNTLIKKGGLGFMLWVTFLLWFVTGCTEPASQFTPSEELGIYPNHFHEPVYNNPENAFTDERIALGKRLFFDPILSADNSISCRSCHNPTFAFSDDGKQFSTGVRNQVGTRNSPPLFNLAWNTSFMWDGGVNHLELVALAPIELDIEMDETLGDILTKINANTSYREDFKRAYDVDSATDKTFLYAMAQYMASLVSSNSKYDKVQQNEATFTEEELIGYNLFQQNCNTCHTEPLFTNYAFKNNGLDTAFTDAGRMRITLNPEEEGLFKVPSLRNLSYSYPYMHDGRFSTLEEVLQHYTQGVKLSKALSQEMNEIQLSAEDNAALLAFLHTLNDEQFVASH
jgi:cytochrome c peroxidase